MVLAPGMIFTIEPMVNMGGVEIFIDEENDWEVYTEDGMPSAQWRSWFLSLRMAMKYLAGKGSRMPYIFDVCV